MADVVGFSRLMARDETGTHQRVKELGAAVLEPAIGRHGGRVVKVMGDGFMAEFSSVTQAVQCAVHVQRQIADRVCKETPGSAMELRIGINLGEVIVDGSDIYGDGVNVAARLERLAAPGSVCVSQAVVDHVEGNCKAAFEDLGLRELKNISRPVRVFRLDVARRGEPGGSTGAAPDDFMRRPAVAVLPFVNMSGDVEQEYFTDGLAEDLITALAAWRSFPVIARNSTFAYKGAALDVRRIGMELGARYVLEGSVRKARDRVRVTGQLIDAETGHHLWAERFDRPLDDVFELQDELSRRISATVAPELEHAEVRRAGTKRTQDLTAWDCYVRGMELFNRETPESNQQARALFQRAIERDPTYGDAWARLGWSYLREVGLGVAEDREAWIAKGFEAARQALAIDEGSAVAHLCLGTAHVWSGQLELGLAEAERALALNPSYAHAAMAVGNRLDLVGRTEEGIAQMERGMQLNPLDPNRWEYLIFLSRAQLVIGKLDIALELAQQAVQLRPDQPDAHFRHAICLAHLDHVEEARKALLKAEQIRPGFLRSRAAWRPYADEARNTQYFAGLRRHGLWEHPKAS